MARPRRGLFARFSLDYADHPKIAPLSDAAFRAHVEMILYSRRYLTDGRIANRIANRWGSAVVTELLTNDPDAPSLVQLDDGDYLLHDYAEMQELREEVEARKRVNRENGKKGGRPGTRTANPVGSGRVHNTETQMKAESESESESEVYLSSDVASDADGSELRPDVEALLDTLDEHIAANGNRPPKRNKTNRDAMRRLLDVDDCTPDQIDWIIRWCQADNFWQANILSAAKLREKFPQLVAKARAGRRNGREDHNTRVLADFMAGVA